MQSQTFIRLQVLLRTTPDYLHKHSIFIISRYFSQHFFKFNLTRKFVRSYGAIIWLQKKKPIAQMSHQPQAWKVKRLAVERQILNNCFSFSWRSLMSLKLDVVIISFLQILNDVFSLMLETELLWAVPRQKDKVWSDHLKNFFFGPKPVS